MTEPTHQPDDPQRSDFNALRYLALALGVIITATWLILDDVQIQALLTGLLVGIIVVAILAVYLRRWWRRRK